MSTDRYPNQVMFAADYKFQDNSEFYMRDSWDVFATRKNSYGCPATYIVGRCDTEKEAQELCAEINSRAEEHAS